MTRISIGNRRARRPVRYTGVKWIKLSKRNKPTMHIGVLIRMIAAGPTYDVACYIGRDADGNERWILADITLDPSRITHYAYINDITQEQTT